MRTTAEENDRVGRWIGERLNRMEAPVRFFLHEGGVSALDAPGQPFHDPRGGRRAVRGARADGAADVGAPAHPRARAHQRSAFSATVVEAFRALHGGRAPRRRAAR